jgi:hypothetical protein
VNLDCCQSLTQKSDLGIVPLLDFVQAWDLHHLGNHSTERIEGIINESNLKFIRHLSQRSETESFLLLPPTTGYAYVLASRKMGEVWRETWLLRDLYVEYVICCSAIKHFWHWFATSLQNLEKGTFYVD